MACAHTDLCDYINYADWSLGHTPFTTSRWHFVKVTSQAEYQCLHQVKLWYCRWRPINAMLPVIPLDVSNRVTNIANKLMNESNFCRRNIAWSGTLLNSNMWHDQEEWVGYRQYSFVTFSRSGIPYSSYLLWCFLVMQIPLRIDIKLQRYEEFVNSKIK